MPALSDGDVNTVALDLPASKPGNEAWVQFDYGHPQTIQAVTLASLDDAISVFDHASNAIPPRLEASDDGVNFPQSGGYSFQQPGRAHGFVRCGNGALLPPRISCAAGRNAGARITSITELVLASGARVNEWEKRAGFANARDFYAIGDPDVAPQFIVRASDVIDLTGKDAARRNARLDAAGGQVDGSAHWVFAHRP